MGLLNRLFRLVRTSLNETLNGTEDPEKLLEQTTADMQANLLQLRQAVAVAIATQKRSEYQYNQAQTQAQEFYNRAQSALTKGNEPLAREALSRRQTYLETAQSLEGQLQDQRTRIQTLKANLRTLEAKVDQARTQKDMYIARARSAKASQKLNEIITQANSAPFNQVEEKILAMEAEAAAAAEISQLGQDPLEKKFSTLESGPHSVDAELSKLKARLQLPDS